MNYSSTWEEKFANQAAHYCDRCHSEEEHHRYHRSQLLENLARGSLDSARSFAENNIFYLETIDICLKCRKDEPLIKLRLEDAE